MKYQFTRVSSNKKTGCIPTTMTEKASCPDRCPLKGNGCYAENFPLSLHWNKVADKGIGIGELAKALQKLPEGQLWRHNVAGDINLDTTEGRQELAAIIRANKARNLKGFTYTHVNPYVHWKELFAVNSWGFTVNISCDSYAQVDDMMKKGLPAVCVVPEDTNKTQYTPEGNKIKMCPAVLSDEVTCETCGICANSKRQFAIGFPAHGARRKVVNSLIEVTNL